MASRPPCPWGAALQESTSITTGNTAIPSSGASTGGGDGTPSKRRCIMPDYRKTRTVLVGSEEMAFIVHEDTICGSSKFFTAACSKNWNTESGNAKEVKVPVERPGDFSRYLHWLYGGSFMATREAPARAQMDEIVEAYLLGDRLDDMLYRNHTTTVLIDHCLQHALIPSADQVVKVYTSTTSLSLLRVALVDGYLLAVKRSSFDLTAAKLPHEFLVDLAIAALKVTPEPSLRKWKQGADKYLEVVQDGEVESPMP